MDWNEYHRLATIHTFMDDLEYNYPSICTTGAIGKSLEGRDLKVSATAPRSETRTASGERERALFEKRWK